jgi:hypothetical protein
MAGRDLASAAGLAAFAVAYLVAGRAYPFDTLAAPGPGVFPLAVGVLLLGLAIGQGAAALRRAGRPPGSPATSASGGGPAGEPGVSGRMLGLTGVLVAYAAATGLIGFLTASFALVLASSRLLGAHDWLRPALLAGGVTAAAYVIFVLWLAVPLPRGPLP